MKMRKTVLALLVIGLIGSAAGGAGNPFFTSPTFSFDWQSFQMFTPDSYWMLPMISDDILSPAMGGPPIGFPFPGPLPPPGIAQGAAPGPWGPGLGLPMPGADLDALSYGTDQFPMQGQRPDIWHFSVDRYAAGVPTMTPPDVFTEGAWGPAFEAAADVFKNWFPMSGNNTVYMDGDGMGPVPWGLGLVESPGIAPVPGQTTDDNLDALNIDTLPHEVSGVAVPIYFSMDSGFVDPLTGLADPGGAPVQGFSGADIMMAQNGVLSMYAPAGALQLDGLGQFPNTDDVDALVLLEDGDGIFNPNFDFLCFSVRRRSAIIGTPDIILGLPIEEGDILLAMPGPAPAPGILIQAEALGLTTMRTHGGGVFPFADELDALDVRMPILGDTNDDGVIDIVDLTALAANWFNPAPPWWTSGDFDGNGVIDIVDLTALAANWFTVGSAPPVPEPTTLALLALGGLSLLRRRRF